MSEKVVETEVLVIGAGAAGLLAAASAASRGKRVTLIEKNRKLGVKILMSGGTRCNITHACSVREITQAFGRNGRFLHSALAALSPEQVIEMIEAEGVETKVESTGKIFPVSNRAIDVRDALVAIAERAGTEILSGQAVVDLSKSDGKFVARTHDGAFIANSVIVTSGGKSYPGCGTTGDGYEWAKSFGHSIVATFPALTPVVCPEAWAHQLKGITIDPVRVKVRQDPNRSSKAEKQDASHQQNGGRTRKPKILADQQGSFLFTHWGFSGPSVLDVSREVARHPNRKSIRLVCDFLPKISSEELSNQIQAQRQSSGRQSATQLLAAHFPKRLVEGFLSAAGISRESRIAEISKRDIRQLVNGVKEACFSIDGTLGFEKAEVTSGGIDLREVDSKTMQSKIVNGLYFAGEILDLDGRIGGFNFQSAFSTGWLAGQSV